MKKDEKTFVESTRTPFYYFDNGYTRDRSQFKSLDEIVEDVSSHIEEAWNEFAKAHDLRQMRFQKDVTRSNSDGVYITAKSDTFKSRNKILNRVFDRFLQRIEVVRGIEVRATDDNDFLVTPYILALMILSWKTVVDETAEDAILLDDDYEGTVFYDIRDRKWYTKKEYHRAHPDIRI